MYASPASYSPPIPTPTPTPLPTHHRQYSAKKIQENIECEIMQVLVEEALSSYDSDTVTVVQLASNTVDDMDDNVHRITQWIHNYERQHGVGGGVSGGSGGEDE